MPRGAASLLFGIAADASPTWTAGTATTRLERAASHAWVSDGATRMLNSAGDYIAPER
jgi:hypothetical protein